MSFSKIGNSGIGYIKIPPHTHPLILKLGLLVCIYSLKWLNNTMGFEKLEDLLPYSVHKIEEKMSMKPEEANKIYEEERENERQYWIKYWIKHTQGEDKQYWINLLKKSKQEK